MSDSIPCLSPAAARKLQSAYAAGCRRDWSVLKASGTDIRKYLQGQITQDMDKLTPQQGIHTCILTPQGKAISDLYILEGNHNELLLLAPSAYAISTVARLRQFSLGYALRIGIVDTWSVLEILGSHAVGELQQAGFPVAETGRLASHHTGDIHALTMSEQPCCFWLIGDTSQLETVTHSDVLSENDIEALRILRGIPRFGTDWNEKIYPMNANMIEFDSVSFDKGCYVGQEVTSRMHWRGGSKKRFYRVELGAPPDVLPCPILTTVSIGMLTSAAMDATGACLGIAHLSIEVAESNTTLSLENGAAVHVIETCHA